MKLDQLFQDVVPLAATRMTVNLAARHHPKRDPAEPLGGPHHGHPPIAAGRPPGGSLSAEVVIAPQQVLGDQQDRVSQRAIGSPHQRTGPIHLIALISRREDPRSPGDGGVAGGVGDRPVLARELGGRDDVDRREAQEQHIRRPHQQPGQVALQGPDRAETKTTLINQSQENPFMNCRALVRLGGIFGPGEDLDEGEIGVSSIFPCSHRLQIIVGQTRRPHEAPLGSRL